MNRILKAIASVSAAAFLLLPAANANTVVCKNQKVKKVSRLCVFLIDQSGAPVPNATLQAFDGEKKVAEGITGNDGKFSFDGLPRGTYQVRIRAGSFKDDAIQIAVTNSSSKCDHDVEVLLYVTSIACPGSYRLVKP